MLQLEACVLQALLSSRDLLPVFSSADKRASGRHRGDQRQAGRQAFLCSGHRCPAKVL